MIRARSETTFGKLRTIRSLNGKKIRIDIEGGSYVTIEKCNSKWIVLLNRKPLEFEGNYNEAVKYAWKIVELVDCDLM